MGIVFDTDRSEVNGGGGSQPGMVLGAEPALEETESPFDSEEEEEGDGND